MLKGAVYDMKYFFRKSITCRSPVMTTEEGNKVLFQVFCNFATGRALVGQEEHLWDVKGKQSGTAKIIVDPKMNTEMKDRQGH